MSPYPFFCFPLHQVEGYEGEFVPAHIPLFSETVLIPDAHYHWRCYCCDHRDHCRFRCEDSQIIDDLCSS